MQKRPYRRSFLKAYYKTKSIHVNTELRDENVVRLLEEQGFEIPHSPRSVYDPDQLFTSLELYSSVNRPIIRKSAIYRNAISFANKCFSYSEAHSEKLYPMTPTEQVVKILVSNPQASAGLTAYGMTKGEAIVRGLTRASQTAWQHKSAEPCIGLARTQKNNKTRLVWGYPFSMTILEGLYARPLLNLFKKQRFSPMAFAMSNIELGSRIRTMSRKFKYAYSLDMSKFDTSIHPEISNAAFDSFQSWFDLSEGHPNIGSYEKVFKMVRAYFHTCPIVMPDGNIYSGRDHGVPSGSYFTQLVDSYANAVIYYFCCNFIGMRPDSHNFLVLGDDLLFFSNEKVNLEELSQYLHDNVGVNMNVEKTRLTTTNSAIHFLGRDWTDGRPDVDLEELLAKMAYPESWRRYPAQTFLKNKQALLTLYSYSLLSKNGWEIFRKVFGSWRYGYNFHDKFAHLISKTVETHVNSSGLARFQARYVFGPESKSQSPVLPYLK